MLNGITWTRKMACAVAIAFASYIVAAFANASPITYPGTTGARSRIPVVVVVPAPDAVPTAEGGPIKAESPEDRGEVHVSLESI